MKLKSNLQLNVRNTAAKFRIVGMYSVKLNYGQFTFSIGFFCVKEKAEMQEVVE